MNATLRPARRARITPRPLDRDEHLPLLKLEHEITLALRDMNVSEDMCELSAYLDASHDVVADGGWREYEV